MPGNLLPKKEVGQPPSFQNMYGGLYACLCYSITGTEAMIKI